MLEKYSNTLYESVSIDLQHQYSNRAISWCSTLKFVEDLGDALDDMKTSQVISEIIFPNTLSKQCSYADTLDDSCVSNATYYVIHSHSAYFLDFIDTLKEFFQIESTDSRSKDIYLWIDIFSMNLHKPQEDLNEIVLKSATKGSLVCFDQNGEIFKR